MYAMYGHSGYFKFKQKYQQYGPCFQTIFSFRMTMMNMNILLIFINSEMMYKSIMLRMKHLK